MKKIGFIAMFALYQGITSTWAADNPLLGTWEWVNIKNSCREVYIFGTEGSSHITSGDETSTAHYQIADRPDSHGYYAVTLSILEDHGGMDCGESVENNSGERYQKYLMFHPTGNLYVSCDTPDPSSCVGPFKRLP